MKKISLFIVALSLIFVITSCSKKEETNQNVGIKINNQMDYKFDIIEIKYYDGDVQKTLEFESINANSSSDYIFIDNLEYSHYDYDDKNVNFVTEATAYIGQDKYQYNIGFCGTGLIFKSTSSHNFVINISYIDLENHDIFCEEIKEN